MSYDFSNLLGNIAASGIYQILQSLPLIMKVLTYVLTSVGVYTLAHRRGISNAWLSWVPVANIWILGSLSDQYHYVVRGQVRSRRKLLLTLKIISVSLGTIMTFMAVGTLFSLIPELIWEDSMEMLLNHLVTRGLRLVWAGLLMIPLSVAVAVFRYMALYDIYMSCDPDNAVMYLVLGIFFRITEPFFLYFNRNKEKGMPPMRRAAQPGPASAAPEAEEPPVWQAQPEPSSAAPGAEEPPVWQAQPEPSSAAPEAEEPPAWQVQPEPSSAAPETEETPAGQTRHEEPEHPSEENTTEYL